MVAGNPGGPGLPMNRQDERGFRFFTLPEEVSQAIWRVLQTNWSLRAEDDKSLRTLAEAVLKMSDFYAAQPTALTPWRESWCQQAQLAYYLPLNFIRVTAVLAEAE